MPSHPSIRYKSRCIIRFLEAQRAGKRIQVAHEYQERPSSRLADSSLCAPGPPLYWPRGSATRVTDHSEVERAVLYREETETRSLHATLNGT